MALYDGMEGVFFGDDVAEAEQRKPERGEKNKVRSWNPGSGNDGWAYREESSSSV